MIIILVFYILFTIFGCKLTNNPFFIDAIKPVVLSALAFYAFKKSENYHGRFRNVRENTKLMVIMAIIYILVFSISGLVVGFAYSIYSHNFFIVLKNIYQITFIAILIEYLRSYLINQNIKSKLNIVAITTLCILLEVNFPVLFAKFADGKETFEYVSSIILPIIFSNIMYSFASLKGGYKMTIPYRIITSIFLLLTPVVPAFDWFLTGIFGIIYPAIIIMIVQKYSKKATAIRRENKKTSAFVYSICIILMITFTLAVYGFFKYKPIVVLSNSMSPSFNKGDLALYYVPTDEEKIKLENNTIIVYTKDNQYVVHRIVRNFKKAGEIFYITRGDANNSDDYSPVATSDIVGVYTTSIKYVGYPSVWLNQLFNQQKAVVETK